MRQAHSMMPPLHGLKRAVSLSGWLSSCSAPGWVMCEVLVGRHPRFIGARRLRQALVQVHLCVQCLNSAMMPAI